MWTAAKPEPLAVSFLVLVCRRELEYAGPVLEVERDYKSRSALVEMKRCAQCPARR